MLLLVVRYGLRAADVCELEFSELDWENNKIVMVQQKTKNKIELPFLADVGDAIIDYLKYSRPESTLQYVFLHVNAPYDRLASSTLHSIVTQYMRLAGIASKTPRKHGPHALRHSLAAILLDKKIPLPVISEVLGHENIESTRHYIRIDMNSLKQCPLDVPPLYADICEGGDNDERF
jgi:integrase